VKVIKGSTTTVYPEGLWEEVAGVAAKAYYNFNGQLAVLYTSSPSAFTYLHNDHLGSAGMATDGAQVKTMQEYYPWGTHPFADEFYNADREYPRPIVARYA
jgi:hypothetical protein